MGRDRVTSSIRSSPDRSRSPTSTGARRAVRDVLVLRRHPLSAHRLPRIQRGRPAFSDPDVRRAAALAIDRERYGRAVGSRRRRTSSSRRYCPGTWTATCTRWTDPASRRHEADAWQNGHCGDGRPGGAATGPAGGGSACARTSHRSGSPWRSRRSVTCMRPHGNEGTRSISSALGWRGGDRDPATFLIQVLSVAPPSWLPEGVAEQLEALSRLTGAERRSTAASLADRLATDEVPIAAICSGAVPMLLSPSLGCRVFLPFATESTSPHSVPTLRSVRGPRFRSRRSH